MFICICICFIFFHKTYSLTHFLVVVVFFTRLFTLVLVLFFLLFAAEILNKHARIHTTQNARILASWLDLNRNSISQFSFYFQPNILISIFLDKVNYSFHSLSPSFVIEFGEEEASTSTAAVAAKY